MAIKVHDTGAISVTGPQDIHFYRLLSLQSALSLEAKGIRMSRRMSALQAAKRHFGLKGSRASITRQVDELVAAEKAKRAGGVAGEEIPKS